MMPVRNITRIQAGAYARPQAPWTLLALVIGYWALVLPSAVAQFTETFESPDHIWKLANADCGVKIVSQKRTFEQAHGGSASEHLRFVAGRGTHLYYTFDLGRSPIIEETNFSLWLKADKARLQLLARVVLPRTLDERTGKPMTALLQGEEYGDVGAWQKLQAKDLKKLLARQTVVLRKQFGSHVDPSEAYIDLLVLNAYGGPGETNVWIDDLEVLGVVDSEWAKSITPSTPGEGSSDKPAARSAILEGNVLLVDRRPIFVRAIEHRGELLEKLKSVGFNAIYLTSTPTIELNAEAKRLGLWLIAPPPDFSEDPSVARRLDRVIMWELGQQLAAKELAATKSLVAELHRGDSELRRPLLAGVASDAWNYSREVDLLCWNMPPLFASRSPALATAALRTLSAEARVGAPCWATVRLGPPPELIQQLGQLDRGAPLVIPPDLEQARFAVFSALAAGARGLVFRSGNRLDGEDEASQHLTTVLRLINLELNLIEPWFSGGSTPQDVPTGDPTLKATLLQTERSRLVVLMREQVFGQFVTPPVGADTMSFMLPGTPAADRIYHPTPDGLKSLDRPSMANGNRIVVPEAGHAALVALTQDPLVIQYLTRYTESQRRDTIETRLRLAANRLTSTALVAEEIRPTIAPPREGVTMLREAQRFQQQADQLLLRNDLTGCYRNLCRSEEQVTGARRVWWDSARSSFSSPLSSPCCATFDLLPAHLRLASRLQQGRWTKNGLPAGDCEQLDSMIGAGWKQQRSELPEINANVELSKATPHGGTSCLRLAATSSGKRELVFESAVVSITTAPIQAREGQVARLHGFVRIPQPLRGIYGGLLIYDNFAGPALAESITHAPQWREFTLYRAVARDGDLTLTFGLAGIGEAFVDDITIELIDL